MTQARFQKREREKARQERAAEKRQRRERAAAEGEPDQVTPRLPEDAVLAELAALHERFAADEIAFDDFEAAKDELLRGIHVD